MFDNLGDRMKKNYEDRNRTFLTRRTPVILRLDGKAFHTLTRGYDKPFDENFYQCMVETMRKVFNSIQGAKVAYYQSDEISILITDFDRLTTEAWFDYNVQKMVSISASIASVVFSKLFERYALFDSRVFNIPRSEVANYFVWRQNDWTRNSIQMLAQAHYSHKELHKKGQADMHEMLYEKGINWAHLESKWKNGTFIDVSFDDTITDVIVKENRGYIEQYLEGEE